MNELRVPTVALAAEVTCTDGRVFTGRIFVPAAASRHTGPMRPEEWINEPAAFFPFLPDEAQVSVLLNKHEVLVITTGTMAGQPELPLEHGGEGGERRVAVECGDLRLEGSLRIDMPAGHRRVLDTLNRPEMFLVLRAGDRLHLLQKRHITRVMELW
jgi:hypothetical protein